MDLTCCGDRIDSLDRYRGNLAINVKYRGNPEISEATLAALKQLDGATRDNVLRYAEEALRDTWWATMQERAKELGLGELWAEGRSGGWLVFKMTVGTLEALIYDAERSCEHCSRSYEEHIDGKCPFDSTDFLAADHMLKMWSALKQFASEVKDSLDTVGDNLEDEVLFQLENLDDDTIGLSPGDSHEANPAAFQEDPD